MGADGGAGWLPHARAAALLLVFVILGVLGTPGLDFLGEQNLQKPSKREQFLNRFGPAWGAVGLGIFDLDRTLRQPLVRMFEPVQRPFRVSQSWSLYRDGPSRVMRMEIQVDGRTVYRSVDDEYTWMQEIFRNRRVRPMVETTVMEVDAPNRLGLSRFIRQRAQQDFPGTTRVDILALWGPFPGTAMKEHHRLTMEAPEWALVVTEAQNKPPQDQAPQDQPPQETP